MDGKNCTRAFCCRNQDSSRPLIGLLFFHPVPGREQIPARGTHEAGAEGDFAFSGALHPPARNAQFVKSPFLHVARSKRRKKPAGAGPMDGRETHGTGFRRGINFTAAQIKTTELLCGKLDRVRLGVTGRVLIFKHGIVAHCQNFIPPSDAGSERRPLGFACRCGPRRGAQGSWDFLSSSLQMQLKIAGSVVKNHAVFADVHHETAAHQIPHRDNVLVDHRLGILIVPKNALQFQDVLP